MFLAASASNQWLMPMAVIGASIITVTGQFVVKKYEMDRQMKTPNHMPEKKSLPDTILLLSEMIIPMLLLGICVWRLVLVLSETSPVTRATVFGIAVFTAVGFVCSVFLLVKLIWYLAIKKLWKENPDLRR
jgi:uncharacterized protein YqhQ